MKNGKKGNVKKVMAMLMLACMLFTLGNVNSNTDYKYDVMLCEGEVERDRTEL